MAGSSGRDVCFIPISGDAMTAVSVGTAPKFAGASAFGAAMPSTKAPKPGTGMDRGGASGDAIMGVEDAGADKIIDAAVMVFRS
ncbi:MULTISPECIES: hypothetical protein [unclassified Sphingobium]|uniref:hypothetical protein n=1 Tax=unclassified Sphingobium TaxID=2611147 RepID=UPI0018DD16C9|nr:MULTISPECIES: hypothetical protein [unclassified Sphingobium]WIW90877.1 hypothetical protein K3M67_17620 [Sphingobium sp. V4]